MSLFLSDEAVCVGVDDWGTSGDDGRKAMTTGKQLVTAVLLLTLMLLTVCWGKECKDVSSL